MELDKLEISLRRRSAWEAIDLGFAIARRWFFPLWLLWLSTAVPIGIVLFLLLNEQLWLLALLVWWLKPLYEPPLLFWLSRAVFGEQLAVKVVLRQWWSVVRPQLLMNLTLRRFNPARSFSMPVALLENLKGKPRRSRISLLGRNQHAATWLTVVGIHLETILELAFITTLFALIPEDLRWTSLSDLFMTPGRIGEWLQLLGALLCMSLIAPFYVAAGFALYLHRRSELEGWDIEINFRQIVQRMQQKDVARTGKRLASLCAAALLICASLTSPPLEAGQVISPEQSRPVISKVLEDEDFGRYEETKYWKFVGEKDIPSDEVDNWFVDMLEFFFKRLAGFFEGFAEVGKVLMWIVGIGIVIYLLYRLLGNSEWFAGFSGRKTKRSRVKPVELFGLDLRAEQLPDNPGLEARRLALEGAYREAMSLLYRGALVSLINRDHIEIPESATEGECLALVRRYRDTAEAEYFDHLTLSWLQLAYGHFQPVPEQVLALCDQWQGVYGNVDG